MSGTRTRWFGLAAAMAALAWAALAPAQNKPAGKGPAAKAAPPARPLPYRLYLTPSGLIHPRFRPPIIHGNNPNVRVLDAPRFDWSFAVPAAAAKAPRQLLADHMSTTTTYQLWVPNTYRHAVAHPLILFVSAKAIPDEWVPFDLLCRTHNVLFAVATGGGDLAHPITRMRITLDMFDDIRRRVMVDPDRVYVAGLSEGARTACELAYAYPEFVGGVLAIGGAASLRGEPYLRDRARERLSVALVTGENDVSRLELTKYRFPVLRDLGVRSQLWAVPKLGTAVPPGRVLEEAYVWLEAGRLARRALAQRAPALRGNENTVPTAEVWSKYLLEEARGRLKEEKLRGSGVALLDGTARRWKGTAAAAQAGQLLAEQKDGDKVLAKAQQEFYHREAKALEDYLAGPLPPRDQKARAVLVALAVELWEQVEKAGAETVAGQEASKRLAALRRRAP